MADGATEQMGMVERVARAEARARRAEAVVEAVRDFMLFGREEVPRGTDPSWDAACDAIDAYDAALAEDQT